MRQLPGLLFYDPALGARLRGHVPRRRCPGERSFRCRRPAGNGQGFSPYRLQPAAGADRQAGTHRFRLPPPARAGSGRPRRCRQANDDRHACGVGHHGLSAPHPDVPVGVPCRQRPPHGRNGTFFGVFGPFRNPSSLFLRVSVACSQARERIPGIRTFPIDKRIPPEALDADRWRSEMARAAAESLAAASAVPYCPEGPFSAAVTIRDGAAAAARMAGPWGFKRSGATVAIQAPDIHALYRSLVRLCYLPPVAEKSLPLSLALYNRVGRLGRLWVRRQLKIESRH